VASNDHFGDVFSPRKRWHGPAQFKKPFTPHSDTTATPIGSSNRDPGPPAAVPATCTQTPGRNIGPTMSLSPRLSTRRSMLADVEPVSRYRVPYRGCFRDHPFGGLGPSERFAAFVPAVVEGSDRADEVLLNRERRWRRRTGRGRRLTPSPTSTTCRPAARMACKSATLSARVGRRRDCLAPKPKPSRRSSGYRADGELRPEGAGERPSHVAHTEPEYMRTRRLLSLLGVPKPRRDRPAAWSP
jgi:hypothetical protein